MRSIVFNTGPLISLVTNNILWILKPLKKQYRGKFYITPAVKRELIDKAFSTKRYEFEAMQVSQLLKDKTLEIIDNENSRKTAEHLLHLANNSFQARNNWIRIVSDAEVSVLAADAVLNSDAAVIDERTVRLLLENSPNLTNLMQKKLHCKVIPNKPNIKEFKQILKNVQILRSTELVAVAYKMGILDNYLVESSEFVRNPKRKLLEAALWALKVRGCSISTEEIMEIVNLETR